MTAAPGTHKDTHRPPAAPATHNDTHKPPAAPPRTPRTGGRRIWGPVELVLGAWLFGLPVVMLIVAAFRTTPFPTGTWTADGFARVLGNPSVWTTLGVTFGYAVVVAALGTAVALVFVTVSRTPAVPLAFLVTPAMIVLIAIPKTLYALAWSLASGGSGGIANRILDAVGLGALADSFSLQNWPGVIFVSVLKAAAIAYLMLLGPVRAMNPSLTDAARISGAGPTRTLLGIEIPLLAPALLGSLSLSLILTMQEFEVPAVLGLSAGVRVFSTDIYRYLNSPFGPDYAAASVSSLLLVVVVVLLVILQLRVLGTKSYVTVSGKAAPVASMRRTPLHLVGTVGILAWIGIVIVVPLAQMVLGSLQPYFGVFSGWTTRHYTEMWANATSRSALLATLMIALVGGLACVLLSFWIAYIVVRRRGTASLLARGASWVPATMPGLVFGLALLCVYTLLPGLRNLYGTSIPLAIGLVVSGVPFAVRAMEGALAQVSPELEEAARLSGDTALGAVMRTTFRILVPSMLAAWILVGFVISGALDVPLLLSTTQVNTVSTLSFRLYNNGDLSAAAALYCMQLAAFALCAAVLATAMRVVARLTREK